MFGLDYQAIKCVYLFEKKLSLRTLLEKLSNKSELNLGFDIIVNEIKNEVCAIQLFDISTPTTPALPLSSATSLAAAATAVPSGFDETDNDDVFSENSSSIASNRFSILDNNEMSLVLALNTTLDASIMHVENTNEFYAQSKDNLESLIEQQRVLQTLAELSINMDFKSIRGQPTHQVGDICLAKYMCDSTWYRGVVVKVNVDQESDDGFSYDVFFVDYGNVEVQMASNIVLSMQCVRNAIKCSKKIAHEKELKSVVELPFMAICCELEQRKCCTRNTEILKSLIGDCSVITFKFKQVKEHYLIAESKQLKIIKYVISLYSNN